MGARALVEQLGARQQPATLEPLAQRAGHDDDGEPVAGDGKPPQSGAEQHGALLAVRPRVGEVDDETARQSLGLAHRGLQSRRRGQVDLALHADDVRAARARVQQREARLDGEALIQAGDAGHDRPGVPAEWPSPLWLPDRVFANVPDGAGSDAARRRCPRARPASGRGSRASRRPSPPSTTGRWRKPPWIMSTAAWSVVSPGSIVSGCGVIRSATCVSSPIPSATARSMSRSVRIPARSSPSSTMTAPTSLATMRLATSVSVSPGATVSRSRDMCVRASGTPAILRVLVRQPSSLPWQPYAVARRRNDGPPAYAETDAAPGAGRAPAGAAGSATVNRAPAPGRSRRARGPRARRRSPRRSPGRGRRPPGRARGRLGAPEALEQRLRRRRRAGRGRGRGPRATTSSPAARTPTSIGVPGGRVDERVAQQVGEHLAQLVRVAADVRGVDSACDA